MRRGLDTYTGRRVGVFGGAKSERKERRKGIGDWKMEIGEFRWEVTVSYFLRARPSFFFFMTTHLR